MPPVGHSRMVGVPTTTDTSVISSEFEMVLDTITQRHETTMLWTLFALLSATSVVYKHMFTIQVCLQVKILKMIN